MSCVLFGFGDFISDNLNIHTKGAYILDSL